MDETSSFFCSEKTSTKIDSKKERENLEEYASKLSISSAVIHSDDVLNGDKRDVAPPLHVSTTFRYNDDPDSLISSREHDVRKMLI